MGLARKRSCSRESNLTPNLWWWIVWYQYNVYFTCYDSVSWIKFYFLRFHELFRFNYLVLSRVTQIHPHFLIKLSRFVNYLGLIILIFILIILIISYIALIISFQIFVGRLYVLEQCVSSNEAIVCVGAVCTVQTRVRTILSIQDIIDNVITHYPESAAVNPDGTIRLDP